MARASTYERLGTLSLHVVLHARGKITAHGARVSTSGLRMTTFRNSGPDPACSCCGLKASYFAVERHKGSSGGYHLNLWGVAIQGNEVLFTHDHTLARALGGANKLHNTSTMCSPCNTKKSVLEHKQSLILRGEWIEPKQRHEIIKQRKEKRRQQIADRMSTDPEYAARVAFHEQRLANLRGTRVVLPS